MYYYGIALDFDVYKWIFNLMCLPQVLAEFIIWFGASYSRLVFIVVWWYCHHFFWNLSAKHITTDYYIIRSAQCRSFKLMDDRWTAENSEQYNNIPMVRWQTASFALQISTVTVSVNQQIYIYLDSKLLKYYI